MKKANRSASGLVLAALLVLALFFIIPVAVQARSVVALEDASFNVSSSIKDNLKTYVGKDVLIHLRSGKSFQGYVKSIGDQFVHLEKLSGREFYDALIRIEDISAIETKFRDMK